MTAPTASSESAPPEARIPAHAWYTLVILMLVYMANSIDRSVMSIVIEPVKHEFALNDSHMGLLTGLAFGLTYALVGIPLGLLVDRTNRRNMLATVVAIWSGCTALCGLAQNYLSLVVARLAVGASESAAAPTSMSMIADLFPKRRRSTAIGVFWASTAFGTATSLMLGGVIAANYGWRAAFFVAGVPGLFLALLLFFTVKEPKREVFAIEGVKVERAPDPLRTIAYVSRNPVVFHAMAGTILNSLAMSAVPVWAVSFLVRTQGFDLAFAGLLSGLGVGVFGSMGSLVGGPASDALVKRRGMTALPAVPLVASLLAVVSGLMFALGSSLAWLVLGFIVFEIVSRAHTAPAYNLMLSGVEPRMRGSVTSVVQAGTNLIGYGVGPAIVGFVSDLAVHYVPADQTLKYGVAAIMVFPLWASLHFLAAWRSAKRTPALTEA